jgi:hydrogenase nickel incorporation protein HypB
MCTVCGCGTASVATSETHDPAHGLNHSYSRGDHHSHGHGLGNESDRAHEHAIDFGAGPAGVAVAGLDQSRILRIERDILGKNNLHAAENRARFAKSGTLALNFVSSPGSGKTSLLARAVADLKDRFPITVIEGDQQTSRDAERIRAAGAPAVQINTGKGCHLDAHMVGLGLDQLALRANGLLFIENVGNLVCPAAFDLGEAHKALVLSVTEGEDKPLKYPEMFAASDLLLLNKSDLLPHLEFDVGQCLANALRINPDLQTLIVSARSGEGLPAFYAWLEGRAARHARIC